MKTYWNFNGNLNAISEWQPNCWIQVTCPTEQDQQELQERFQIPDYFLSDIADTDERARYEYDDGWMLIILRIPYVKEVRSRTPYTTVPLGIIHKRDVTITVCNFETNMMIDFVSYQQKRGEGFTDYVDMIFRLFLSSAVWYLKRLKQINALIEKSKKNLDKEVNNESLIGLSRLQDSLTYFQHLFRHPRIDDGHLLQYHQQQHEHRDAYAHLREYHHDAPHPGLVALRHEPHQRHGGQSPRLPPRPAHIRYRFGRHMVDFAPQTAYLAAERKKLRIFLGGINYFV